MKYFDKSMTANEVRKRLYDLLYLHRVPENEVDAVKAEHSEMCKITVKREMALADAGWMTEQL